MTTGTSEIQRFAGTIYRPDDVVEIRRLRGEDARSAWHHSADLPALYGTLETENRDGWNVYIGVNSRRQFGAKSDAGVLLSRAVFFDIDHCEPFGFLCQFCTKFGLPIPGMSIASGHGLHGYYPLAEPVTDLLAWRELQHDLAVMVGGDAKVRNPERIMRLPGFLNVKKEPHVACRIIDSTGDRFDFAALRAMVKPRPKETVRPAIKIGSASNVPPADRLKRCLAYLAKCPDAVSGQDGHGATIRAACEAIRFGLCESEVWHAMQWFNAHKCQPAWSDKELAHKIADAHKIAAAEAGSRLQEHRQHHHPAKPMPRRRSYLVTVGAA